KRGSPLVTRKPAFGTPISGFCPVPVMYWQLRQQQMPLNSGASELSYLIAPHLHPPVIGVVTVMRSSFSGSADDITPCACKGGVRRGARQFHSQRGGWDSRQLELYGRFCAQPQS